MIKKQNLLRRFFAPVFIVFIIMTVSWSVYNVSWRIDNAVWHHLLAAVSGTSMFLSITFGALLIYPLMFFRGASLPERVIAALINPFIWATKECLRLYASFAFTECLYYYLNPLNIWLLCGILAQLGLAETICRYRLKKMGKDIGVLAIRPCLVFALSLFLVVFLFAWGQGENVYVIFLKGFRHLFGPGVGVGALFF
jgi:hypothetical protein